MSSQSQESAKSSEDAVKAKTRNDDTSESYVVTFPSSDDAEKKEEIVQKTTVPQDEECSSWSPSDSSSEAGTSYDCKPRNLLHHSKIKNERVENSVNKEKKRLSYKLSMRNEHLARPKKDVLDKFIRVRPEGSLPEDAHPVWHLLPLQTKVPMDNCPRQIVYRKELGSSLEVPNPEYFDLFDEHNMVRPTTFYTGVHDPYMKSYHTQPSVRQRIARHGFMSESGRASCSLREMNHYREYLRRKLAQQVQEDLRREHQAAKEQQAKEERDRMKKEEAKAYEMNTQGMFRKRIEAMATIELRSMENQMKKDLKFLNAQIRRQKKQRERVQATEERYHRIYNQHTEEKYERDAKMKTAHLEYAKEDADRIVKLCDKKKAERAKKTGKAEEFWQRKLDHQLEWMIEGLELERKYNEERKGRIYFRKNGKPPPAAIAKEEKPCILPDELEDILARRKDEMSIVPEPGPSTQPLIKEPSEDITTSEDELSSPSLKESPGSTVEEVSEDEDSRKPAKDVAVLSEEDRLPKEDSTTLPSEAVSDRVTEETSETDALIPAKDLNETLDGKPSVPPTKETVEGTAEKVSKAPIEVPVSADKVSLPADDSSAVSIVPSASEKPQIEEEVKIAKSKSEVLDEPQVVETVQAPESEPELADIHREEEMVTAPESKAGVVDEPSVVEQVKSPESELDAIDRSGIVVTAPESEADIADKSPAVEQVKAPEAEPDAVDQPRVVERVTVPDSKPDVADESPAVEQVKAPEGEPDAVDQPRVVERVTVAESKPDIADEPPAVEQVKASESDPNAVDEAQANTSESSVDGIDQPRVVNRVKATESEDDQLKKQAE